MQSSSEKKTDVQQARNESHGRVVGAPTPEAVETRAIELAQLEGRAPEAVTEDDRLRAARELHGKMLALSSVEARSDLAASGNPADMAVESGHEVKRVMPLDEQQNEEREIKEGIREAEHERMVQGQTQNKEPQP